MMKLTHRYIMNHEQMRFLRFRLQASGTYFIAGTHSMFVPSRSEKYVLGWDRAGRKTTRLWEDERGDRYEMTPGEAARAELRKTFPGLKRIGWQSGHVELFDWRWPMLYSGSGTGEGVYIDLVGAYHQLYSRLWLDTAFPCGYGSLSLVHVADALRDWKPARNAVIGICACRGAVGVKGYQSIRLTTKNVFLSPGLWATIQAILNEIAYEAQRCGAIYIATDGYIFPGSSGANKFIEFLFDNGLRHRESRGYFDIKGWGCYRVAAKKTKNYEEAQSYEGGDFNTIKLLDARQPKRVLRWWAKSIPTYSLQRWEQKEVIWKQEKYS